jgi:tRNA A-37 threonylcarbamoyl transferase component Bud32
MPHGGESLDKFTDATYLLRIGKKNNAKRSGWQSTYDQFIPELPAIYASMDELIAWLPTMHGAGLTHSDMGTQNLVWDGTRVRLIDWGYATLKGEKDFERETAADIEGLGDVKDTIEAEHQKIEALPKEGGGRKTYRIRKQKKKSKHTRRR